MGALQGVGVLVTRPEHQAAELSRLLESHGATVTRLPVLLIEAAGEPAALRAALNPARPFDLVIFTSANAVRFGAPLLDRNCSRLLAAIGPATARALEREGLGASLTPTDGFDSESLLAHPVLTRAAGRRVLIIKGTQGRELLQEELTRRGAQVVTEAVYQRTAILHGQSAVASLQAAIKARGIDIVTATSVEIAGYVLDLVTPLLRPHFDLIQWLVPGERVATALRTKGLAAPILKARSADDQDLVAEILRWRAAESGA